MPVFPGQLRHIRKNLFHAVFVLDPATISGLEASLFSKANTLFFVNSFSKRNLSFLELLLGTLQSIDMIISLYESDFPVRFGVVLYSSKYITQLENLSAKEDRDKFEEDISDMVIFNFNSSEMYTTSQSSFFRKFYCQVYDALCLLFFFSDYTSLQLYQGES